MHETLDIEDVDKCLQGNLCRCTGYRPIIEGFRTFCQKSDLQAKETFDPSTFKPYQPDKDDPATPEKIPNLQKFLHFQNETKEMFAPTSMQDLLDLMKSLKTYHFVQGGTGHYQVNQQNSDVQNILYLGHISDLMTFQQPNGEDCLELGAGLKLIDAQKIFKTFPALDVFVQALSTLGSPQVRNVATIGGSIMWANPSSDLMPLYLTFGCKIQIAGADGTILEMKIKDLTADLSGGVIIKLIVPLPQGDFVAQFRRKAKRKEFDLATLNMGASIHLETSSSKIKDANIAFGGSDQYSIKSDGSKKAQLAQNTMDFLTGKSMDSYDQDLLEQAIKKDLYLQDLVPVLHGQNRSLRQNLAIYFVSSLLRRDQILPEKVGLVQSSQLFKAASDAQAEHDLVERPVPHMWAAEQACGTAQYVDDMTPLINEVKLILIRSSKSHAKLKKIDLVKALAAPGIIGSVTASDLTTYQNLWGLMFEDEEVFASEKVLYHGQIIGALACTEKKLGQEALKKVLIEYEELPAILNLKHATEHLGMNLDELETFGWDQVIKRDQTEEQKEPLPDNAETLTGSIRIGSQEHFYMEPHSVVAIPVGEKDEMVVYTSTQEVGVNQTKLSRVLELPMHKIIVKIKRVGGGFGGKERMHAALIAAVAAKKLGRPVRLVLTRKEDMETTGQKHEAIVHYNVQVDPVSFKILKIAYKVWANAGISADLSVPWVHLLILRSTGGYTVKNFEAIGKAVKTNSPSNTALRGFGGPEGTIVIETIMDRIAHVLKKSPLEVRQANLTREGDLLHHSETRIKGCTLQKCWDECLKLSQYESKKQAIDTFNKYSKDIKRGLSLVPLKLEPGLGGKSPMRGSALVRVYKDGSVLLTHGGIEMGQGIHTKMIQVASRALGISADLIHINEVSTETLANTSPTGGSSGADLNGPAILKACEIILERLKPYKTPEGSSWKDWVVQAVDDRVCLTVVGHYDWSKLTYDMVDQTGDFYEYLTYGVGAVQTQVNCKTGDVQVLSADIVMDVGKSLNPAIDIGQIEGAFLMALGSMTNEQMVRDLKTGQLLTNGPSTYKIPTVADVPREFNVKLIENEEGPTSAIYSSKGVGEPPSNLAAAIVLSIKEAVSSYRIDQGNVEWFHFDPPCTSDKIVNATLGYDVGPTNDTIEM
jgi:xanthine dehydrogenase/oxidase